MWHDLIKNPTDLPRKDGFCEIAYIRKDGTNRTSKAFYRVHPKKQYYRDKNGVTRTKLAESGWNIQSTANVGTILAWKDHDSFFAN